MSTHNLYFEQKYAEKLQSFLSENFLFLEMKFSIQYLNRRVFVIFENLHQCTAKLLNVTSLGIFGDVDPCLSLQLLS